MRAWVLIAVGMILVGGCVRVVTPLAGSSSGAGLACTKDAECATGHCVDGACCDSACGAQGSCALARAPGRCTQRTLGDPCQSQEQCGGGAFCVDGVCCNAQCQGECRSCQLAGSVGRCLRMEDNTDPQAECAACHACFSGVCRPASQGTSPKLECADQETCDGAGGCGLDLGVACDPRQAACASGYCLLNACGDSDDQLLGQPYADTTIEYPLRILSSGNGVALLSIALTVTVEQQVNNQDCPELVANVPLAVMHFQRLTPSGNQQQVVNTPEPVLYADMVETRGDFVVVYFQGSCRSCDLNALTLGTGVETQLASGFTDPSWVSAASSPSGKVAVAASQTAFFGDSHPPQLWVQSTGGTYERVSVDAVQGGDVAGVTLFAGENPVLLGVNSDQTMVYAATLNGQGQPVATLSGPFAGCTEVGRIRARDLGHGSFHVMVLCVASGRGTGFQEMDLDVSVPGQVTFGSAQPLVFDPPLAQAPDVFDVAGPPGAHSLVFQQGSRVHLAWRQPDGTYVGTQFSSVGNLEPGIGYLTAVSGPSEINVAWNPGHLVARYLTPVGCPTTYVDYLTSATALASLRF